MSPDPRRVTLLGSTGSIGTQAIDVIRAQNEREPGFFEVAGLAAGGSDPVLVARQAASLRVPVVAIARDDEATRAGFEGALRAAVADGGVAGYQPQVLWGAQAAAELAAQPVDVVLNGITGSIGLMPTLAALQAGSTLALANKESLIVGGPLVRAAVQRDDQLVPVDSEHSALAQCLRAGRAAEVRRLIVTASGGPFRGRTREQLREVTPSQALAHPTWDMGRVVTTNSATLVNKGLEVIEAHLLFDIPFERITVVVHPTSDVHSMVEFHDGSTIMQASPPTMMIPIALGLAWPERLVDVAPAYDWSVPHTLEFHPLDDEAFPAVRLAREVGEAGGTFPAVYNAANEECVDAFHDGRIGFLDIVDTVECVVADHAAGVGGAAEIAVRGNEAGVLTVEQVLAAETWARRRAHQVLGLV